MSVCMPAQHELAPLNRFLGNFVSWFFLQTFVWGSSSLLTTEWKLQVHIIKTTLCYDWLSYLRLCSVWDVDWGQQPNIIIYSKFVSRVQRKCLPHEKQEAVFGGKPINTLWMYYPHKKQKEATICCSYTEMICGVTACNMDGNILNPQIVIVLETTPKFEIWGSWQSEWTISVKRSRHFLSSSVRLR